MERLLLWLVVFILCDCVYAQTTLGGIIENTNAALPSSYNFKEYVFAEPVSDAVCNGRTNASARIGEIFISQTHRNPIGHPFFFLIGARPALLQLAITGSGNAPDVLVEGYFEDNRIGTLCMKGPEKLSEQVDLSEANFTDYFSVTLPKSWMRNGLELIVSAGSERRVLSSQDLNIGPYTEMNLVMVNMDVLDYNISEHEYPIFDRFIGELASAIPASVIRFGTFPVTLKFPELVASNNTERLVRLKNRDELFEKGIDNEGNINSVAMNALAELHKSTGDFLSTVYFGNTLNLAPGGWGGGKSFVSNDFTDIFIHELGHALSLPHWEETLNNEEITEDSFLYPYKGEDGSAGGRGPIWNFIQDTYEFEDAFCRNPDSEVLGLERSDAMQREVFCPENRQSGLSNWDGFGNFSAYAMYRYLTGASVKSGEIAYRGFQEPYQLSYQDGFPTMTLNADTRYYRQEEGQLLNPFNKQSVNLPGDEKIECNVHLIYGTLHKRQALVNIIYEPLRYKGTLPPILDPTNPEHFQSMKAINQVDFPELYGQFRDITIKVTYDNGEVLHALLPFASPLRNVTEDYGIWRADVLNFSLVVPGDQSIAKIEAYDRPFMIGDADDDIEGNINFDGNHIAPSNFMDASRLLAHWGCATCSNFTEEDETLVIHPNPFRNRLNVSKRGCSHNHLSLFNMMGQKVFERSLECETEAIEIEPLAQGIYIAVVKDSLGKVVKKQKVIRE